MKSQSQEHEPIAIVGIGCRMPGGVRDVPGLWEFLRDQKDVWMEFDEPRFSAKGFYHPNNDRPGTAVASHGFLLDEDPLLFDPAFFGITDTETETLDAAQRKLLECTYEAFENAGDTWESVSGSRTGVFVGDICFDNYLAQTRDWEYSGKYSATGSFPNMLANRLHYIFNLKGPSLLINSACTSAMYALHLAITSMRNGDCDSAIVAGSNWIMDPNCHIAMGKLGALSATSRSHTFDASADGYARGEGFAALYLKTPSRAMKDASPIRGLVIGSAVNANGRTKGITNPSGPAQEIVIREAYKNAGLDPSATTLLECHDTGTRVGDPIEVHAAGNVFGLSRPDSFEDRLIVGSVKTNVGHLEGACALPGILKVVAALEAGEIPPTLGYKEANPRIDFDGAKARVNADVEPWPKGKPKRASVTSAGFGGTNGHCIIDHVRNVLPNYVKPGISSVEDVDDSNGQVTNGSNGNGIATNGANGHSTNGTNGTNGHSTNGASENGANGNKHHAQHSPIVEKPQMSRTANAGTRQHVVFPFSAHNQESLKANMSALAQVLSRHSLADVAYTLSAKRSRYIQRAFYIVDKDNTAEAVELAQTPKVFSSPQPLRIGFAFTGQGAQWHAMGAELFEYAVFRKTITYLDQILTMLPHPASWTIEDVLSGKCEKDLIQVPAVSQTLCTALQIGLVDLLASWSVLPSGVVGHSSGEMAAAYAAGRITAAEAITAAYYRGYMVSFNKQQGAMLAVGVGPEKGLEYIQEAGYDEKVRVAAINSPDSITMSGDAEAVERLAETLNQQGVFNRLLKTGGLAYHSHHMLPLGHDYTDAVDSGKESLAKNGISGQGQKYPSIPWFSSVTPAKNMTMSGQEEIPTAYWRSNLESPVRFTEALSNLLSAKELGIGAVIEIGPHPALKSPVGQIVKALGKSVPHVASVKRGKNGQKAMAELAGTLFALNADVDLVAVNAVDDDHSGLVHGSTAIDLPPYQYNYGPIKYHETRASKEYRLRKTPRHDLLGSKIPGTTRLRPQWRNVLTLKDLPWLDDHRVPPHVLHPGAAHIVMAMLAAEHAYKDLPGALPVTGIALRNVSIKKTLVVPEDDHGIEIVLSMELGDGATAKSPGWATFSISSIVRDTEQWTEHCSGLAKVEVSTFQEVAPIDTTMDGRAVDAETRYKRFAEMGLQFGPSFQGYSKIRADPIKNVASATLALNTTKSLFPGGESEYPIHPASLDLVIRLGLMACNGGQAETGSVQLPIHLNQLRFKLGAMPSREWATGLAKGELRGLRGAYAQLQMLGENGDVILDVDNMRFIDLANDQGSSSATNETSKAFSSPFNRLVWRPDIRTLSKKQCGALFGASDANTAPYSQLLRIIDLMGHANPDLRVLQIGTSRDMGASEKILKALVGSNGIKQYREYLITDVSNDLLPTSNAEFRDVKKSVLDISKDPLKQGYKPVYDVVLSVNAIHDFQGVEQALQNCGKLLRPGGKLVLLEPTEMNWEESLLKAGFSSGAELTLKGHYLTLSMATQHSEEKQADQRKPEVHLLHGSKGAPALLSHLAKEFEQRGLTTKTVPFEDALTLASDSRVVAFLDNENLLLGADQHRIELFQHLAATTTSMIWLTSSGMVKGRNPDAAFVSGLLRTLGSENPAGKFLSIDIDADDFTLSGEDFGELVRSVVDQELTLHADSGDNGVNREYTWQDGSLWVSRIVPDGNLQGYADAVTAPDDNELELVPLSTQGPVRAAFGTPGILSSLYFQPYLELLKPLPKDWIELKVLAIGLNWKDLGLCTGRFDQNNLSNEYCGIVTKKGSSVSNVDIGDRVHGMGKGHFGNYTRVPAVLAQKLQPDVDPIQAATIPLVYMTAVYAFEHVTRVRKGQKVLIQSASGGLGLAAIQLARSKGAEIYVTAGTSDKTRFLNEQMNIPSSHIFSSRDITDVKRMVQATRNGGFDVILSNSQGDMLYESVKALAPMGHLIDVGRLDVTSSKNIALELFQKSASFTSFDLGLVIERDVEFGGELMRSVHEHFTASRIGPVNPSTVSDVSQLDQALLRFSKGTHIGKTVVSYTDPNSMIKKQKSVIPATFDPEARYVLVGGLSGLGRSIVRFMSDRGARNLAVWSRSGPNSLSTESKALIEELAAKGVVVRAITCDVSKRDQVLRAMEHASSDRPVRGVFNFAVSYQDISFDKMTEEKFHEGMAAKVLGTRNLHEATASMPLDFFSMISSFGTVYAFPTQSTYLAANNWLDYFARYRRRAGLPVSTVSLGFISDLGALTQDAVTVNLFTRTKGQTVTGSQVLRMLEPAFVSNINRDTAHDQEWAGYLEDPLSGANIVTGIDPAVLAAMKRDEAKAAKANVSSGSAPRWYHDARVSVMLRAVDDAWHHQAGNDAAKVQDDNTADKSPTAQLRRQFQLSINKVKEQAESGSKTQYNNTVAFVTDAIRKTVAGMLFVDPSAVNVSGTVVDHGIDSLLAAEFRNWLHGAFGKNITMLDLMDARTKIDALAQKIVDEAA
ncbi:ketoacyl-synt-domain-containing protein [Lepidopterella palustris CBS 459.81]|uniref:Ketoacyl-synt-domain-containing protein n=1 Tax=Lepidopterella palustris CBS 459.81 TaxID=1314670 RepID=A0A8E2E3X6_9PEZI|nr:ketoacyl-synt-domain-containing protein [Lepidopterella palustris CBS 459.81]